MCAMISGISIATPAINGNASKVSGLSNSEMIEPITVAMTGIIIPIKGIPSRRTMV